MYEAPRITEVGSVKDVTLEQTLAFDYDGDLFHKGKAS
ncbi:lasso RiPP family leader peptide-containing protein [Promicromonospora sp. Marseille-Q5078]